MSYNYDSDPCTDRFVNTNASKHIIIEILIPEFFRDPNILFLIKPNNGEYYLDLKSFEKYYNLDANEAADFNKFKDIRDPDDPEYNMGTRYVTSYFYNDLKRVNEINRYIEEQELYGNKYKPNGEEDNLIKTTVDRLYKILGALQGPTLCAMKSLINDNKTMYRLIDVPILPNTNRVLSADGVNYIDSAVRYYSIFQDLISNLKGLLSTDYRPYVDNLIKVIDSSYNDLKNAYSNIETTPNMPPNLYSAYIYLIRSKLIILEIGVNFINTIRIMYTINRLKVDSSITTTYNYFANYILIGVDDIKNMIYNNFDVKDPASLLYIEKLFKDLSTGKENILLQFDYTKINYFDLMIDKYFIEIDKLDPKTIDYRNNIIKIHEYAHANSKDNNILALYCEICMALMYILSKVGYDPSNKYFQSLDTLVKKVKDLDTKSLNIFTKLKSSVTGPKDKKLILTGYKDEAVNLMTLLTDDFNTGLPEYKVTAKSRSDIINQSTPLQNVKVVKHDYVDDAIDQLVLTLDKYEQIMRSKNFSTKYIDDLVDNLHKYLETRYSTGKDLDTVVGSIIKNLEDLNFYLLESQQSVAEVISSLQLNTSEKNFIKQINKLDANINRVIKDINIKDLTVDPKTSYEKNCLSDPDIFKIEKHADYLEYKYQSKPIKKADFQYVAFSDNMFNRVFDKTVMVGSLPTIQRMKFNFVQRTCFGFIEKQTTNLLICAPTGVGKTNIAVFAIINYFINSNTIDPTTDYIKKILYLTPTKTLVDETGDDVKLKLNDIGCVVYNVRGNERFDNQSYKDCNVLLTTAGKFDATSSLSYDDFGLVIIDEVHKIGTTFNECTETNEFLLETIITKFKLLSTKPRIIGLSGTIKNYNDVAEFIESPLKTDPDPVKKRESENLDFGPEYRSKELNITFSCVTSNKMDEVNLTCNYIKNHMSFMTLNNQGSLVFCGSFLDTWKTGYQMLNLMGHEYQTKLGSDLNDLIESNVTNDETETVNIDNKNITVSLKQLLKMGIGIHSSNISEVNRKVVEALYANGNIKIICCTLTLAIGVNLPTSVVVFLKPNKDHVGSTEMMQAFGRAGRKTEGFAYLIANKSDINYYAKMMCNQNDIESNLCCNNNVISSIMTYIAKNKIYIDELYDFIENTFMKIRLSKNQGFYKNLKTLDLKKLVNYCLNELRNNRLLRIDTTGGKTTVSLNNLGLAVKNFEYNNFNLLKPEDLEDSIRKCNNFKNTLNFIFQSGYKRAPTVVDENKEIEAINKMGFFYMESLKKYYIKFYKFETSFLKDITKILEFFILYVAYNDVDVPYTSLRSIIYLYIIIKTIYDGTGNINDLKRYFIIGNEPTYLGTMNNVNGDYPLDSKTRYIVCSEKNNKIARVYPEIEYKNFFNISDVDDYNTHIFDTSNINNVINVQKDKRAFFGILRSKISKKFSNKLRKKSKKKSIKKTFKKLKRSRRKLRKRSKKKSIKIHKTKRSRKKGI